MKALKLTIHRQWFDLIESGEKTIEYREVKPHWKTRLENREYEEVHFRNGYRRESPFMRVQCLGISKNDLYQIHLGKVLEVRR